MTQDSIDLGSTNEYTVHSITKSMWNRQRKQTEFTVTWLGWPNTDASWEPSINLEGNTAFAEFLKYSTYFDSVKIPLCLTQFVNANTN